jgi:hypothetical protein
VVTQTIPSDFLFGFPFSFLQLIHILILLASGFHFCGALLHTVNCLQPVALSIVSAFVAVFLLTRRPRMCTCMHALLQCPQVERDDSVPLVSISLFVLCLFDLCLLHFSLPGVPIRSEEPGPSILWHPKVHSRGYCGWGVGPPTFWSRRLLWSRGGGWKPWSCVICSWRHQWVPRHCGGRGEALLATRPPPPLLSLLSVLPLKHAALHPTYGPTNTQLCSLVSSHVTQRLSTSPFPLQQENRKPYV